MVLELVGSSGSQINKNVLLQYTHEIDDEGSPLSEIKQ